MEMKRVWRILGISVGIGFILVGLSMMSTGEPYVEFRLDGFLNYNEPVVSTIAVGFSTTPLFDVLRADACFIGVLAPGENGITTNIGGKFLVTYGNADTYVEIGSWIDSVVGFSPFINLRVSIPLFALFAPSGGP